MVCPTAEAYVVEIPIKLASKALKLALLYLVLGNPNLPTLRSILKPVLLPDGKVPSSYPFLRRFVATLHLPLSLRNGVRPQDGHATLHLLVPPPLPLNPDDIINVLQSNIHSGSLPIIRTALIPLDPPTTVEQAALWSEKYWPCTFNPSSQTIQKAPPLRVLRTTQAELDKAANLKSYFSLTERAAAECADGAVGRKVAAVIVDPLTQEVIALAGDARWYGQSHHPMRMANHQNELPEGRPEHHALMRAIAIVAEKEAQRHNDHESPSNTAAKEHHLNLGGKTLTPIENSYAQTTPSHTKVVPTLESGFPTPQSGPRPDAYLCNGLDVYLTHEPCIACSMAMIHSRFRACVFQRRMPKTGGLCAESDQRASGGGGDGERVGYGLFWRSELNWRVLTFQYLPPWEGGGEDGREDGSGQLGEEGRKGDYIDDEVFHA